MSSSPNRRDILKLLALLPTSLYFSRLAQAAARPSTNPDARNVVVVLLDALTAKNIQLYGSGFLTEGVLEAAGDAANGVLTTMHYSDSLDTPRNKKFRLEYAKTFKMQPDVYAVQGYDAGLLYAAGLKAVKGDVSKKKEMIAAMRAAQIDSPRGKWTLSKSQNPIQDMYLRKVVGKENRVMSVAMKALDYPPSSTCKMPA